MEQKRFVNHGIWKPLGGKSPCSDEWSVEAFNQLSIKATQRNISDYMVGQIVCWKYKNVHPRLKIGHDTYFSFCLILIITLKLVEISEEQIHSQ